VFYLAFAFRYLKLHNDIDVAALVNELKLLKNILSSFAPDTFKIVRDVSKALIPALSGIYRSTARLYLTVAMSNAAAERSFSCLRRLKNHLTNKPNQEHLNHRLFLHIHKHLIDQADLIAMLQEFIEVNDRRINSFGKKFVQ